ncbi:MAG: hypothetical protein SGJ27_17255 [Candidatus Melainabacteria bacterium]|nr:hypothetical protein [Candidatus Melainabacteria bacterium]
MLPMVGILSSEKRQSAATAHADHDEARTASAFGHKSGYLFSPSISSHRIRCVLVNDIATKETPDRPSGVSYSFIVLCSGRSSVEEELNSWWCLSGFEKNGF